jgi:hypothetical protein
LFPKTAENFQLSSENEGNVLILIEPYSRDQKIHTVPLEKGIYILHTYEIKPEIF